METRHDSLKSLNDSHVVGRMLTEETHIRQGGGPQNKGGSLANKRYQMSELNYKSAGGKTVKPTL
jgi:hypothetical protein